MTIKEFEIQDALGSIPEEELENMAKDPNTYKIILRTLSTNEDYHIRWHVAENSNTPADILKVLANDVNDHVCESARDNLEGVVR